MAHLAMHEKVKNIRRDPRVALSLLSDKTNAAAMREYVVVHGKARVTDGGAVNLLQRLAPIYLGPGAEYPPTSMRNIAGYVTRITPGTLLWDRSVGIASRWLDNKERRSHESNSV